MSIGILNLNVAADAEIGEQVAVADFVKHNLVPRTGIALDGYD